MWIQRWKQFPLAETNPTRQWLWIIVAIAVTARLAAALLMGDRVEPLPAIYDQISYNTLAQNVLAGKGFSFDEPWWPGTPAHEPTAHWSFLYTLYLAVVYLIFGYHPLVARLIQAVLGALLCLQVYRLGRRLAGPHVGLVAAGIVAVYAYLVYYAAALMTETFYILAIMLALNVSLDLEQHPSPQRWAILGLAIGIAALLRQTILLFLPVLLLWLWWKATRPEGPKESKGPEESDVPSGTSGTSGTSRSYVVVGRSSFVVGLLITLAVIAALIAPWTVRNYLVYHTFLPLNSNVGFALYWAAHPDHYAAPFPPEVAGLNEAQKSNALLRYAIRHLVLEHPGRYLWLSLSQVKEFFQFWPSPESGLVSNLARVLSFGICLPFMIHGLFLSFRRWRAWMLCYLFLIVHSLVHIFSMADIRYRLPMDPILIVFAGLSIVHLATEILPQRLWPELESEKSK